MRNSIRVLRLLVLIVFTCLPFWLRAESGVQRKISVVMDNNYPPYSFLDNEGHLQGILIDRWKLWEKKTGIAVELHGLDWVEALRRMQAGEFDVIDTIFETEERKVFFDYSKPHTNIEVPIFFHQNISGITDLKSLRDFPVAVKKGDFTVQLLKDAGVNSLLQFNNYEAIILAARQHRIHVFIVDKPPAHYFLNKYGIESEYRQTEPIKVGQFHRAYPKGKKALFDTVETGFSAISEAEYAAIDKKWFGTAMGSPIPLRILIAVSATIFALVLALVIWNQALRWQVEKRTSALRESEAKFRDSLEFMPMPLGIANDRGEILFFNHEFTAHFGYTMDDTKNLTEWASKAYPEKSYREATQRQWESDVALAVKNNTATPIRTYQLTCKDGTQRDVEIVMRPLSKLMLTSFNDVTERNRKDSELKQSESRYRRLHETMQDAFARVDMTGAIIESNRAFREMLGYEDEELRSLDYVDITPEKWHASEQKVLNDQVRARGYSDVYEKEYVRKDGTIIPVELRTFLLKGEAGEPSGMWAIVRETTDRKRIELQLIQAQKMEAIGQLAGGVAHDFNNILASILLNVSMLQSDLNLDEPTRNSLQDMRNEVNKAAALTRQLLSFSRRQAVQMSPVDLDSLLSNALAMLRRLLGERIQIEYETQARLPFILGNAGMLEQVVMNLCVNARDAMPQGGKLTLRTTQVFMDNRTAATQSGANGGCYVKLSVGDTGVGMAPDLCQRIFEPFFTTKELGQGTGLGLSIVFGIVKQHGGWINVESAVGVGTTFDIYLPAITTSSPQEDHPTEEVLEKGNGESILLVEDEDALRAILCTSLRSLGYTVSPAASPSEALVFWDQQKANFDLLLTDMIMPGGVSGLDLAKDLCAKKSNLKVIIASGYHKEFDDAGIPSGITMRKIHKPFPLEKLSKLLREILTA